MKKNTFMRVASALLVAVLLTTCAIAGTFAKYTTEVSSNDAARVAKWGFGSTSIDLEDLFSATYTNVAAGSNDMAIIAPGTSGSASFEFEFDGTAPEVAYTFEVSTDDSDCDALIQGNTSIKWALTTSPTAPATDDAEWGTWTALLTEINGLTEDGNFAAGELPDMVNTPYYVHWTWLYEADNDAKDTELGNAAVAGDLKVTLVVTITATQKD